MKNKRKQSRKRKWSRSEIISILAIIIEIILWILDHFF